MSNMNKKFVLPGDEIAAAEEYIPCEGTYEDSGKINSRVAGYLILDEIKREVRVIPLKSPVLLKRGSVILGRVFDVYEGFATVSPIKVVGNDRQITSTEFVTLHISKISKTYIKNIKDFVKINDVIKGKVIKDEPNVQITIADRNLGVIFARCSKCRSPLVLSGHVLKCMKCMTTETRKISSDYGKMPHLRKRGNKNRK